jgi:hypothetical protein
VRIIPRLAARLGVIVATVSLGLVVAVQYESLAVHYFTLKHEVDDSRAKIDALETKLRKQKSDVRRLSDPRGAVPEIHDKLKEFGPDEEMIYVRGVPSPAPGAWENSR